MFFFFSLSIIIIDEEILFRSFMVVIDKGSLFRL